MEQWKKSIYTDLAVEEDVYKRQSLDSTRGPPQSVHTVTPSTNSISHFGQYGIMMNFLSAG